MEHKLSDFHFNPFAGISHEDIDKVIIPKPEVRAFISKIDKGEDLGLEFMGKKGRGKTTHLIWLHLHFPQYPLYLLNNSGDKKKLLEDTSQVLFVDSIHHLSLFERLKLFRQAKSIIYTSHWPRKWEAGIVGRSLESIRFKGISQELLSKILHKRFLYAAKYQEASEKSLNQTEINYWIRKHGDNFRGILNDLYHKYQNYEGSL